MSQINFDTVEQALKYKECCPFCKSKLTIDAKNYGDYVFFGSATSVSYKLNIKNNELVIAYRDKYSYAHRYNNFIIAVDCVDCYLYSYDIIIFLDNNHEAIESINLISERFCFVIDYVGDCEIVYRYNDDKMNFYFLAAKSTYKDLLEINVDLPIMPLDVDKPELLINRAKSLMLFT